MGMRAHIDAFAGRKIGRSHVIEKDERSHHPPFGERQDAPDFQAAAEVFPPRGDDDFDHAFSLCRELS
jgi:hypothetical protein